MKKLPMMAATATLAIGGAMGTASEAWALEGWRELGVVETNVTVSDVALSTIEPERGYLLIRPGNLSEGRKITKAIFATFDYKNGITMEQADHLASILGENKTYDKKWADVYVELSQSQMNSQSVGVNLGSASGFLEQNPSDVIYYAFLEENPTNPEVEAKWVRGKWDYRTCAHASKNEWETTPRACYLQYDYTNGGQVFLPSGRYEVEPGIITWAAELKQIGEAALDEVDKILTTNEAKKENGEVFSEGMIASIEADFTKKMSVVEKMGLTEVLGERIKGQVARKKLLLTFEKPAETEKPTETEKPEGTGNGGGDGDLETDKTDKTEGETTEDKTEQDKTIGGGAGGNAGTNTDKVTSGDYGGMVDVETSEKAPVKTTESKNDEESRVNMATMENVVKNTETDVETVDLGSLKITDRHPEVAMLEDEITNQDLLVPNLGEIENAEEATSGWFWAILIAVVGALGTLGWKVGKHLLGKYTDEDEA